MGFPQFYSHSERLLQSKPKFAYVLHRPVETAAITGHRKSFSKAGSQ